MTYELYQYAKKASPDLSYLVEPAEAEQFSFVTRTGDEWNTGTNRFADPGEVFFVAVSDDLIVGMCGLNKDPYLDEPGVGRLRHLYIHPHHRRVGMAQALVARCLSLAPATFGRVRLRTSNPAASILYCSMGFELVDEPSATHEWRSSQTRK